MKQKLVKCKGYKVIQMPEGLCITMGPMILARRGNNGLWSVRKMTGRVAELCGAHTKRKAHEALIREWGFSCWRITSASDTTRAATLDRALEGLRALTLPARVRPDSIRDCLPCGTSDVSGMRIIAALHKRGAFNGELVRVNEQGARVCYWHVWRIEE